MHRTPLMQMLTVWMKLRDVILSRSLPLRVRVMNTSHDAEAAAKTIVGEDLQLTTLKEDIFLRANSINDGELSALATNNIRHCSLVSLYLYEV